MEQVFFAFLIWLVARTERPLRRLCAPPLPAATVMRWWVRRLQLALLRPVSPQVATSSRCRPATLPYLLYPLSCSLLE